VLAALTNYPNYSVLAALTDYPHYSVLAALTDYPHYSVLAALTDYPNYSVLAALTDYPHYSVLAALTDYPHYSVLAALTDYPHYSVLAALTDYPLDGPQGEACLPKVAIFLRLKVDVCHDAPGDRKEGVELFGGRLHQHQIHGDHSMLDEDEGGMEDRVDQHRLSASKQPSPSE
jgi:hypothetical protein